MALSTTQERLERSLFERIRSTLVQEGYLPDIVGIANDPSGQANWQSLIEQVKTDKGFCIELFGVGSSQSKFLKRVPRIVIHKTRYLPSQTLGKSPSPFYVPGGGGFEKLKYLNSIFDAYYDIIMVSNEVKQDRIMAAVVAESLPNLGYVDFINASDTNDRFPIELIGSYNTGEDKEGVAEYVWSFKIPDLILVEPKSMGQVSPILEITVDYFSPELIGTQTVLADPGDFNNDFNEDFY